MTNLQIQSFLHSLPAPKAAMLQALHQAIQEKFSHKEISFLDGKDESGKIVSNPNIGYGSQFIHYKDGSSRPFYQVGITATSKGISVYLLSIKDKNFLKTNYATRIGKANVTGYCIQFKSLTEIDQTVLFEAIAYAFNQG